MNIEIPEGVINRAMSHLQNYLLDMGDMLMQTDTEEEEDFRLEMEEIRWTLDEIRRHRKESERKHYPFGKPYDRVADSDGSQH